ncbi:ATP-binding protein [Psychrobacillus sp. AK 1817]|uniref:AlbA family DNA-binding domain-containing protein n=1 Tax=Psychrobacillus sp. AK 1817 TaxID=2303505 RepID=UPI0012481F22|nr:ATP-binding protein [Psychrobacillus sp. AK 1817]QEY19997.1 ATP-binding protein [Psychrobacillus sp. AK 1817]
MKNIIKELIENGFESDSLDFKERMYPKNGTPDLLKDILSMANSNYIGPRYIVMGVKDRIGEIRSISGISSEDIVDSSSYQQFILNNIEPDVNINLHYIDYQDNKVAVIEIDGSDDKPYLLKKQYKNLNQGLCLIRKGSTNSIANRTDFDRIYEKKTGKFEIKIIDEHLRAIKPVDGTALLDISLRNLSTNPVTIVSGILFVKDYQNKVRTKHVVYGFESEMGADFSLEIPPKRELIGELHVGFGSTDCLKLNLDKYGYTDERFIFELHFRDSYDNEYQTSVNEGFVFAKGEFLWKVAQKMKNE